MDGERLADSFPLVRWATWYSTFAERDGLPPLPPTRWSRYWVYVYERDVTDEVQLPDLPSGSYTLADRIWRVERIVVRHPQAESQLRWAYDNSPLGAIAITGLETDHYPERSARILGRAIVLLGEWARSGAGSGGGRPPGAWTAPDEFIAAAEAAWMQTARLRPTVEDVNALLTLPYAYKTGFLVGLGRAGLNWKTLLTMTKPPAG